jgi:ubiquinone/menaquinone biosynthesis C-methylase UbiE
MEIARVEWKTDKTFDRLVNEHWEQWLKERMGSSWRRMLDLGGGTGWISAKFSDGNHLVVCMDISQKKVNRGVELFGDKIGMNYILGDAHNLPFMDEAFDVVHSWAALHHFPDKTRAMNEIKRVLRPGGKFLALEPGLVNPLSTPARTFFPTVSHDELEKPFVPSMLEKMVSKFFPKVETKCFGVSTYTLPFILARMGKIADLVRPVEPHLIKLDDGLSSVFKEFAGVIAVSAEK